MEKCTEIWEKITKELSNKMSAAAFFVWINGLQPITIKNNELILLVSNKHTRESIEKNYMEDIKYCVNVLGYNFSDIVLITEDEKHFFVEEETSLDEVTKIINKQPKQNMIGQFRAKYTFENFVVGESNKLAYHSAKLIAENPNYDDNLLSLNPLYIYGGVGLGKTHLLQSIGNYISENSPDVKIMYVASSTLTNDYFNSLNKYSSDKNAYRDFREKYTNVDVLMIDDIQYLQKKGGLQEIMFIIFNSLYMQGKHIILSSDRPPKEINDIEDRLRTRFEGGLMTDIYTPDIDTRIAIIMKKMEKENINLSEDIIYYLAEKINTNIRELEGALIKIIMYSKLINKVPTLEIAKEALKLNENDSGNNIDSNKIIESVCSYYRISKNDIIGKKRTKEIAEARMISMYLIRELLTMPLINIGQIFGGRDHSTVIYNCDKVRNSIEGSKINVVIKDIRNMLNI
ncbi:MAG: chromosomal replication initiator protein DnaA [Clostridia bacterium]